MQTRARLTLAVLLSLALAPCIAAAQGDKAKADQEKKPTQSDSTAPKPEPQAYLVALSIKESDSGKPTLEKNYNLTVITDDFRNDNEHLRDGDRVPFVGEKGHEYIDIGTNIDVNHGTRRGEAVVISLGVESTSLAAKSDGINLPQINQWRITVNAVLVPGKPTLIYSATDALTGHKVEIQATAQPLSGK